MLRADKDDRILFLDNEFLLYYTKFNCQVFGRRGLKLQSIDGLFESKKIEKARRSNIVEYVQKKYFSYIIDKIVLLRGIFSKALFILSWFILLFLLLLFFCFP